MRRFLLVLLLAGQACRAAEEGVSPAALPIEDDETMEAPALPPAAAAFSGDVRIRTGDVRPRSSSFNDAPPSLRHGPYASQRTRLKWGDRVAAGVISLRPSPGPSLSAAGLRRAGTVKEYVQMPGRVLAGDYSLSFGQGLIFYDGLGEFVRSAWVQGRGAAPDLSSGRGNQLRGAVVEAGRGAWRLTGFGSRLSLDLPLGPDGAAARDLWALRGGAPLDPDALATTEERIWGGRFEFRWGAGRAGLTAARAHYAPDVRPPERPFSGGHVFRGGGNVVAGVDAAWEWEDRRLAVDAARSRDEGRRGGALAATLFQKGAWASVFSYGPDYFARQGKGPAFDAQDLPVNQRGLSLGIREEVPQGYLEGEAAWASFPEAQGDGGSEAPVLSSQGRRERLEGSWEFSDDWTGLLRLQERVRDRAFLPPGSGARTPGEETVRRLRLETVWRASRAARLRLRYDARWERSPAEGRRAEGRLLMAEVLWRPSENGALGARCYAFQSPEAYLTSGVEEVWEGVVSPLAPGGMGNFRGAGGERYALSARRRWGKRLGLWAEYGETLRWRGAPVGDSRRGWRAQMDASW